MDSACLWRAVARCRLLPQAAGRYSFSSQKLWRAHPRRKPPAA